MLATSRCSEVTFVGTVSAASGCGIRARRTPEGRYPADPAFTGPAVNGSAVNGPAIAIAITGADREWLVHLRPAR